MPATSLLDGFLQSCSWFSALSDEHQALVRATAQEIRAQPGESVAQAGEPSVQWLGVIYGFLKMYITEAEGSETILYCLCKDEWGGEGSLLKEELRRYSIVAMTPSILCSVPIETFKLLHSESLPFNHFLVENMNAHLGSFIGMLQSSRLNAPERRVAECLLMLARGQQAQSMPLSIKQHDLALISGLSRQRTNMALQSLKCRNLVRTLRYGRMTIDLPAVENYLGADERA
jgi:CRP-like cAMP-binding protein